MNFNPSGLRLLEAVFEVENETCFVALIENVTATIRGHPGNCK